MSMPVLVWLYDAMVMTIVSPAEADRIIERGDGERVDTSATYGRYTRGAHNMARRAVLPELQAVSIRPNDPDEVATVTTDLPSPPPVKRGRGRPRKVGA